MPFGLKNAGTTYQHLMNKVFRWQIRRNMEVYVDDILIKSLRAADLCADIKETCHTLRTYGIKLNPQKCLFGAKSGHFLGYIVIERGIEANPSKIYLSLTDHAVGSALVRSDGEEQPIYFLRHILKDVESRYTGLKKLAFALVLVARRLRPYFLAHTIIVITNNPLSRILLNPEASGRLIKWTTELNEFDIQYQPRTTIKAQSLADFITEVQDPEPEITWKVYVDGSSTRQGSGVGILLISPKKERMQLSVRLDYQATNNKAEYEALIAGLQVARHVGAIRALIHSDSQLAAQQLSGTFEINSARLRLYAEAFKKLKANFQEVVIKKVPRAENQAADELAKLASFILSIIIQQPIDQVALVAHIDRMEGLTFLSDWRTTLIEFLRAGATPSNQEEAHLLRRRAGRFTLIRDQLYKKDFSRPLLKCVRPEDIEYILQEYDADNAERRQLEFDLVDETRAKAVAQLTAYRQRMRQGYNRRVISRSFQVGDLVWKKHHHATIVRGGARSIYDVSDGGGDVTRWFWPWRRHRATLLAMILLLEVSRDGSGSDKGVSRSSSGVDIS
ncbi:uncharacterized protein LOC122026652 [Zingiber officinale]|uniref:uncharacterized protein LOC122026652 n=1 Tax=Zingiber officinale TaxID=94328 RepID=UPI001C4CA025|nr:uncharacterized protein LOC122026652 [Zingiber officinale]